MKSRPAETAGGITGLATAIAALCGASVEAVAVVGTVAGLLPAVVTFIVSHGGITGVLRAVWQGSRGQSLVELMFALVLLLIAVWLLVRLF